MKLSDYSSIRKLLIILSIALIFCPSVKADKKEDIVILKNGDRITGEIKRMEVGILILSTDDLRTLNIEWDKIQSVQTKNLYEVELEDGRIYFGSLWPGNMEGTLLVVGAVSEDRLFMQYIVKITRIKESFWDTLEGYAKMGFYFTKANNIGQLSLGLNAKYRSRFFYSEMDINSMISTTGKELASRKQDLYLYYQHFMGNKWFWGAMTGAEENTELGLDLRALAGAGVGFDLIQNNQNLLNAQTSLVFNREWYADSTETVSNIEALLQGNYKFFIYDAPKTDLDVSAKLFPSLTNFGRVRFNLDVGLSWELFIDFYWDVSFYLNYDNKSASTASNSDYGIESAIKYEF
jgi:hypothetical protein